LVEELPESLVKLVVTSGRLGGAEGREARPRLFTAELVGSFSTDPGILVLGYDEDRVIDNLSRETGGVGKGVAGHVDAASTRQAIFHRLT
jgi:hypothetical protein